MFKKNCWIILRNYSKYAIFKKILKVISIFMIYLFIKIF